MKSLFEFKKYQDFLAHRLEQTRGELSRLSEFIPCQKSYLTRALKEEVQLTPDQGHRICEYFLFAEEEREYFMSLLEYSRAGNSSYKDFLKNKIVKLKKAHEEKSKQADKILVHSGFEQSQYYALWYYPVIHILTSIPEFQTIEKISNYTSLPPAIVESAIAYLIALDFIELKNGRYIFKSGSTHLSSQNPMVTVYHRQLRDLANRSCQLMKNESLHFSMVQSVSKLDFEKIRDLMIEAIQKYNQIATPSKSEEAVILNIDFFKAQI